jgi:hypothetical protein
LAREKTAVQRSLSSAKKPKTANTDLIRQLALKGKLLENATISVFMELTEQDQREIMNLIEFKKMMKEHPRDIPLYHITHIDNLPGILASGGLWRDRERMRQGFQQVNIAYTSLKERRMRTPVPVFSGKILCDFVPFYFANRSPMLYAIHTDSVEGYTGGQSSIIYLVTTIGAVITGDRKWCFTDGHAVEFVTDFYDSLEGISAVDWELIHNWSWKNTLEDNDRKRRKQAEFLVEKSVPWTWIERIGVINHAMKKRVEEIIGDEEHRSAVSIETGWYY